MFFIILLCIGICGCQDLGAGEPSSDAGKPVYIVNIESPVYVMGEDNDKLIDTSRIVCERHNDSTAVMYGVVEILKQMPKSIVIELILKKEASGKYEIVFSHDICAFCDEVGNVDSDYFGYLQYINIPQSCPFDAGSYNVDYLIVDMSCFEIKDQNCGDYLAELHIYEQTGEKCKSDRVLLYILLLDLSIVREG